MGELPTALTAILTDRYRVERELGQGGMATVYLAQDLKHDRMVALKVLKPELGAVLGAERFLTEIKVTARLDHPHILTLLDSGAVDGVLYYVLPFVRGESLRVLLNRETQLGVDDALAITRQIASALDYAHRQGVVHRDIKPENILIHEGEAMLTDFGIALAIKEAGGSRLTETGLSLGTPQYMSPEQATGDRQLDARSDLYSLAAVLYEMLTGEPPMTGPTVQAVIAKLLTESPTRIRTVRGTVPEGVDNAVAKALAKVPADRYATAGDFAKALELTRSTGAAAAAAPGTQKSPALKYAAIAGGVAVLAAAAYFGLRGAGGSRAEGLVALRDRTQVTFTGDVSSPTISQDGKQLAYWVKDCKGSDCSFALMVQDVGSTTTRRILEGATSAWYVEWSPDRRNLIVNGTVNGRYGTFIVSAQGGAARHLTAGTATFYAGGDSLLIGPSGADSAFTFRFATLDGVAHDSIRIHSPGDALASLLVIPGSTHIVAQIIRGRRAMWQVLDRSGKVLDSLTNSCTCGGSPSHGAIWMTRAGPTVSEAVVRVAVDPKSGRFSTRQDTVYNGRFTNVAVTADGGQFLVDDGSYTYSTQVVAMADLLGGRFPSGAPLLQASTPVGTVVSPDGGRLLLRKSLPNAGGGEDVRLSIAAADGSAESPLAVAGKVVDSYWADSVTLAIGTLTPRGTRIELIDVRNGSTRNTLEVPDSLIRTTTPLPDGWAWIGTRADRIVVERGGQRGEIQKPAWAANYASLDASPDGSRIVYGAWNAATEDTLRFEAVPTAGGTSTTLLSSFAERGYARWLADGSVAVALWSTPDVVTLYRVSGPGRVQTVGRVAHPASAFGFSRDLKRASVGWRDYRGDAWLYRVAKP